MLKGRISIDSAKVEAVSSWPVPKNIMEIKRFLGLAGYYRRLVERFSKIAALFTALARKGKKFEWTLKCEENFHKLKKKLTSASVLIIPVIDAENFMIYTDTSKSGLGATLIQNGKVVAYASRQLKSHKKELSYAWSGACGSSFRTQKFGNHQDTSRKWCPFSQRHNFFWKKEPGI